MINLLPPEIKKQSKLNSDQKDIVLYGTSLLIFAVVAVGVQLLGYIFVDQRRDDLQQTLDQKRLSLEEINLGQKEAIQLSSDIKKVGALLDRQVDFSGLIQSIGSVLPTGSSLNSLSLGVDNSEPITLQFQVDTQEKAAIVQKNLKDSSIFVGADIQNITISSTDEDGEPTSFGTTIVTKFSEDFLKNGASTENNEETTPKSSSSLNLDLGESDQISLSITDSTSGFLFFKTSKATVSWQINSTAIPIFDDNSIPTYTLYTSTDDSPISSSNPIVTPLNTRQGSLEVELPSDVSIYNFAVCISHPLNTGGGCSVTSEAFSL